MPQISFRAHDLFSETLFYIRISYRFWLCPIWSLYLARKRDQWNVYFCSWLVLFFPGKIFIWLLMVPGSPVVGSFSSSFFGRASPRTVQVSIHVCPLRLVARKASESNPHQPAYVSLSSQLGFVDTRGLIGIFGPIWSNVFLRSCRQ